MMKLLSPYKFRERLLLVGGGGAGKTTAALSCIRAASEGEMFVADIDYSLAWDRAIDTDFEDVRDRVHISAIEPEWSPFIEEIERIVEAHNLPDNWLVIDSVSPTYEFVQSWYVGLAMGNDLGRHMAELRRDSATSADYSKALGESMNWPAIKKEYSRLYRAVSRWRGHLILTAEAKSIKGERDTDLLEIYGHIGYKPVGEGRLHHVTATTLFMSNGKKGYEYTTCKDRNRDDQEHKSIEALAEGGFADSYLREVAGWKIVRQPKKAAASA